MRISLSHSRGSQPQRLLDVKGTQTPDLPSTTPLSLSRALKLIAARDRNTPALAIELFSSRYLAVLAIRRRVLRQEDLNDAGYKSLCHNPRQFLIGKAENSWLGLNLFWGGHVQSPTCEAFTKFKRRQTEQLSRTLAKNLFISHGAPCGRSEKL